MAVTDPNAVATGTANTQVQSSQTPNWYDQLAVQFGNTLSGANSALDTLQNNWYDQPRVADMSGLQADALHAAGTQPGVWQPGFDTGMGSVQGGLNSLSSAASAVGGTGNYDQTEMMKHLNPYLTGALNTLASNSNQNLFENVIPGINSTFTGAGQFGSTRNGDFMNRAVRDNQNSINNASANMLNTAYGQAANDYSNWDAARRSAATAQGTIGGQQIQGGLGQVSGALQGAGQGWTDINNQFSLGKTQQDLQQKGLDTGYSDWLAKLQTPLQLQGALTQMIPNFTNLYKPTTTTTSATTNSGTDTMTGILNLLSQLSQMGKATATP